MTLSNDICLNIFCFNHYTPNKVIKPLGARGLQGVKVNENTLVRRSVERTKKEQDSGRQMSIDIVFKFLMVAGGRGARNRNRVS